MNHTFTFKPRNSLVLISSNFYTLAPESMNDNLVSATEECVAVGTSPEDDLSTVITISNDISDPIPANLEQVYEGIIKIHAETIGVFSVLGERFAMVPVNSTCARIIILANDAVAPDRIVIVVRKLSP